MTDQTTDHQRQDSLIPVYTEFIPAEPEPGKLYISERFSTAIHLCACGCGIQTVTPLRADGWTLATDADGAVSLNPSIGNGQFPCHSHYFVRRGRIEWLSPMSAEAARSVITQDQATATRTEQETGR